MTLMSLLRRERLYRSALGFRKRDLERGLALIPHLNTAQREGALTLMRKYYKGYLFSAPSRSSTRAVALFLKQVSMRKLDVDSVLQRDVAGVDLLEELLDDNVKLSPSFLALARKLPAGERCVTALVGASTPLAGFKVKSTFRLDEIVPELAGQPEEQLRTGRRRCSTARAS